MEPFGTILLIVNPIAGHTDKAPLIKEIQLKAQELNANLHVYKTTGNGDREAIKHLVKEIAPIRVIITGGDGTIKLVAEAISEFDLPIAIIPSGSANALSLNLAIPHAIQDQIDVAFGNYYIDLDVLDINGELCLHMGDLGMNAELIKNYEAFPIRGKFGYVLQVIPTLIKSRYPFQFHIKTDTHEVEREGILLAFSNVGKYGTGANVNPHGKPNDGIFEILLFKYFDVLEIFKTLRNEEELNPDFVEIIPTTQAKITCAKPVALQVDGEYLGEAEEVSVKLIPQKIKLVVPKITLDALT